MTAIGYARLIGSQILFPNSVAFDDTPVGHLEFALRHEGVNLEVIDAAFEHIEPEELIARLRATPTGERIRRACFLWEWLTGKELDAGATVRGGYVDLFPADVYLRRQRPPAPISHSACARALRDARRGYGHSGVGGDGAQSSGVSRRADGVFASGDAFMEFTVASIWSRSC
ncbi:hypothetical protein [Caballeronia sp. J97]|uniref:hypothetical protein n=1 Tax=Caballeronia sp. J97 TaxID=2805429 RepID=UPI002AB32324|nr:hypothetical protein [Caballeronia sp. J97]